MYFPNSNISIAQFLQISRFINFYENQKKNKFHSSRCMFIYIYIYIVYLYICIFTYLIFVYMYFYTFTYFILFFVSVYFYVFYIFMYLVSIFIFDHICILWAAQPNLFGIVGKKVLYNSANLLDNGC